MRRAGLVAAGLCSAALALAQTSEPAPPTGAPAPGAQAPVNAPVPVSRGGTKSQGATRAGATRSGQAAGAAPQGVGASLPAGPHPYVPERFAGRAGKYYRLVWGVEGLSVKWAESGEVIRFSYHVLDPTKAGALNEKRNQPLLIDPKAGVQLVVPQMENIGLLRQTAPPEAGRSYWIAFSNKGRLVKRGDHVIVQVGPFKADGLVID